MQGQRQFGVRHVEPRQKRAHQPLFIVLGICILILSLILCWCITTNSDKVELTNRKACTAGKNIPVKFLKIIFINLFYLIIAKEFYFYGRQWLEGHQFKRSSKDDLLFFSLILGVIAIFSECDKDEPMHHMLARILLNCILVGAGMAVIFASKIIRNKVDSARTLKRNPHAVGPGLAMAFVSFLENVINGKCGTPTYSEAIEEYRRREGIVENYWLLYKVLILFPESRVARESVEECRSWSCNHRICFEKIRHEYEASGQARVTWMEVLKVYGGERRGYVAIAENRPLNTLYAMLEEGEISREVFNIQFHVYKNELKRILDQTPGCRGNYEFFHYRDSPRLDFGGAVIQKINALRAEEA